MYQRFPGDARSREPSPASAAPQSVLRAVRVMYVGLAASLLGILVDMTTLSATRSEIIKQNPKFTTAQVNSAEHLEIGLFIAGGLIGAAAVPGGGLTRIYGFVIWAIGLVAIFLLWQRSSSDYFRGAPRS